jgi:hypothetical protein
MINQNLLLTGDDGYNLTNSLRFRSSASAYLNRTFGTPTLSTKWTWSGWFKLGYASTYYTIFDGGSPDTRFGRDPSTNQLYVNNDTTNFIITTPVYRDYSAWYHAVLAFDSSQGTASNRLRLYINGSEVTAFATDNRSSISGAIGINTATAHGIGRQPSGGSAYFDGYMAEINFVDGQQLTPSSFGETSTSTGVWIPKKYTGTYGTNGFYLKFTDTTSTSTLGTDFSGNSNTWTVNNISLTAGSTYDSMTDVPTLTSATAANYAVMNPLDAQGTATLSDANLTLASSTTAHKNRKATFVIPSTGKWYWELTTASTCSASVILGWGLQTTAAATDSQAGNADTFMAQNDANQDIYNQTTTVLSTGSAVAGGSIRQVAYDSGTGKLWFGVNNTWYSSTDLTSGNPSAGTNECMTLSAGSYFPTITCYNLTANVNFGQQPFTYTPPTGFVRLNTFNLPTPTIGATASELANEYFDASLWTGNSTTNNIVNAGGMQPDFVWIKSRSNAQNNDLFDSVRGAGYALFSNATNAETNNTANFTSFNSNGFSLASNGGDTNLSGYTYVGWQWRASNTTAVTNTNGTITSTVSASTTAGFSVVTGTFPASGTSCTFGHGLGVAPSMIISKGRDGGTSNWIVRHTSLGNMTTKYLEMNNTGGVNTGSNAATAPSSTLASVSTDGLNNNMAFVAYCFAQVAGYSAFGSYTGNGSSDGPFVFTGFRPRWLMIKRTDATQNWAIVDTSRDTFNVSNKRLFANLSDAEDTGISNFVDLLSNGFKFRDSNVSCNASGGTYIYAAFCESPFKFSNAR